MEIVSDAILHANPYHSLRFYEHEYSIQATGAQHQPEKKKRKRLKQGAPTVQKWRTKQANEALAKSTRVMDLPPPISLEVDGCKASDRKCRNDALHCLACSKFVESEDGRRDFDVTVERICSAAVSSSIDKLPNRWVLPVPITSHIS